MRDKLKRQINYIDIPKNLELKKQDNNADLNTPIQAIPPKWKSMLRSTIHFVDIQSKTCCPETNEKHEKVLCSHC